MEPPDSVSNIRSALLDSLDDLSSSRSSQNRRIRALTSIERLLANICVSSKSLEKLTTFIDLQDGFECNVASRIASFLSLSASNLQLSLSTATSDEAKPDSDLLEQCQPIMQALSILQGVCLLHPPSKSYLGRKWPVQTLLDLLMLSRHLPSPISTPLAPSPAGSSIPLSAALASAVLDTLLCVLVDAPPALRVFEEANGVENVVKTLKRTGVAREVRMKCLEFLYFYLLPEDGSQPGPPPTRSALASACPPPTETQFSPTRPNFRIPTPYPPGLSYSSSSEGEGDSPPESPKNPLLKFQGLKDVDFVPVTPKKKHQAAKIGMGTPRALRTAAVPATASPANPATPTKVPRTPSKKKPSTLSIMTSDQSESMSSSLTSDILATPRKVERLLSSVDSSLADPFVPVRKTGVRTSDEKKELLGTWIGNVDALVEGVQKAGVWGLG